MIPAFVLVVICLAGHAGATPPPVLSASEIDYPPFSFADDAGDATGFSVELMREALAAMNREVLFRVGPWEEVRGWLEHGEVEALPLVGRTPERETLYDFTFPYMSLHGAIVVRDRTPDILTIKDLRGKQVAVMKGDNAEEFLRREDYGAHIHTVATFEQALQELSLGQHDAVVIQRIVALRLIDEADLKNLTVIGQPIDNFRQDFCFAVKEGDRATLALLNEGLAIITADGTYRRLHAKWFAALQLPSERPIVIGGDHDYPPFEYLDRRGRPAGYNVDLTRAIARELDLDIEIRLGPWSEIIRGVKRGEIDALQGMFHSYERERTFDFTQPHLVTHYVAVARAGEAMPPSSLAELAGKRVVLQSGDLMHDWVLENGFDGPVAVVNSQAAALRALAEGDHDCALVTRLPALYSIKTYGWENLVVGKQPLLAPEYCYAVPKGNQALLTQLSEGLVLLEATGQYREIYDRWLGIYQDRPPDFLVVLRYSALVIMPLLLVLLLVFLWSFFLRRQVADKTRALRESLDQFQYVFESANVGKSLTRPDGRINANEAFARLLGYTREEINQKTWQELSLPDEVTATEKAIAPLLQGEADSTRFEKRYLHRDGTTIWADVSTTLRRDDGGEPLYFVTTIADITRRKEAETSLRENEAFQSAIVRCSPVALYSLNMDGKVTAWNASAEQIFGWTADEVLGKPLPIVPADQHTDFECLRKRCLEEGGFSNVEVVRQSKDGGRFPAHLSTALIRDTQGRLLGIMEAIEDITEQKRAHTLLLQEKALYEDLVNTQPAGIYRLRVCAVDAIQEYSVTEIIDTHYSLEMVSNRFCEIIGAKRRELEENPYFILERIYPDDKEVFVQECLESLKNLTSFAWEGRLLKGDDILWVRFESIPYKVNATEVIWTGILYDFTERKTSEENHHKILQQLELHFNNSPLAVVEWDNQLRVRRWSQRAEEMFEWRAGEAMTKCPLDWQFVHEEDQEAFSGAMAELLEGRTSRMLSQNRNYTKSGSVLHCEWYSSALRNRSGKLISILSLVHDITDQVKADMDREALQVQLNQSQKMESVGRLAGGVAHDFNNMLTVILGYTELALDKVDPADPLHAELQEIYTAANRSADITRQLLAFARKQTIAPRVLDLNDTLEGMLKMLRRLIGEDIDLAWMPEAGLWPVKIDPSQLDQILANLCVNARDAINGVGKVTIETGNASLDEAYCASHTGFTPGDYVLLAVSDDGCGMDAQTRDHAFEPFFTTKGVGEGTGLGLATIYGIVKQNEGFINVYSEPDRGTTIRIYLPRYFGALEVDKPEQLKDLPRGDGVTVLVAEDETAILKMSTNMLTGLGYTVLAASTPNEALRLAREHAGKIDLLMTDVVMPEMNGRELAERLQTQHPKIKLLFMSGYTANVIAHQGVLDEEVAFIQKPFSVSSLATSLYEALHRDHTRQ